MPATAADASAERLLPDFEQVRSAWLPSDAVLLDRHGEPLADQRLDFRVRRLNWVRLDALPAAMREALLAAEDKRFFEHTGIDWKAFLGAAWQNLWSRRQRGASTLTMQLAGLLDPALHLPAKGRERRSLSQKWDQSLAAIELERHWSKTQILEAYLNLAPFRGDLEGIGAASELLLGVSPQSITRREAVILAALLRGPNARPALVARRACALANVLRDNKLCGPVTALALARLDAPRGAPRFRLAPQLARTILKYPGQQLNSTLDAATQRNVLAALTHRKGVSAAIVLDNASGEVLAWAATSAPGDADPLMARENVPLWWSPYAAALGIEQRSHTAASLLIDPDGVLDAKDARAGHSTTILSLRTALTQRNGGALREFTHQIARELGQDALAERLRQFGFDPSTPFAISNPNGIQLANAWRSLFAGGNFVAARGMPQDVGTAHRVGNMESAFITTEMFAETTPNGWRSSWSGSSVDAQTQILVGSTDRFTVLVHLARSDRNEDLAGGAQQVWREIVGNLQRTPARMPAIPEGVVSSIIVFEPPDEPARREWFLRGTEVTDRIAAAALPSGARLVMPRQGQTITMNNGASGPSATWPFEAITARATHWLIDGKPAGHGALIQWSPTSGRHRAVLLGAREEVLDSADFEVVRHQ